MKFGTFVFDFGQVIGEFNNYDLTSHFVDNPEDAEIMKKVFFDREHWDLLDMGAITDDEVKVIFHRKLPERLHKAADNFYDNWIEVVPAVDGMEELIRELKANGAKLYILSNFSVQFAEHYGDSPIFGEILGLFDGLVFSGPIKTVKPDPKIFEYIINKYSLTPSECLFIDDNAANTAAGEKAGFVSYLFDGDTAALRRYIFDRE